MLHWGAFMLLTGGTLLLAGARRARHWIFYNGANLLSLVAFAGCGAASNVSCACLRATANRP